MAACNFSEKFQHTGSPWHLYVRWWTCLSISSSVLAMSTYYSIKQCQLINYLNILLYFALIILDCHIWHQISDKTHIQWCDDDDDRQVNIYFIDQVWEVLIIVLSHNVWISFSSTNQLCHKVPDGRTDNAVCRKWVKCLTFHTTTSNYWEGRKDSNRSSSSSSSSSSNSSCDSGT